MRPPEFTGGKLIGVHHLAASQEASMRPPEFTGGKVSLSHRGRTPVSGFNEAAGIHRRKGLSTGTEPWSPTASMRPPEFTGGKFRTGTST